MFYNNYTWRIIFKNGVTILHTCNLYHISTKLQFFNVNEKFSKKIPSRIDKLHKQAKVINAVQEKEIEWQDGRGAG